MKMFLKINILIVLVLFFVGCENKDEKNELKVQKDIVKSVFVVKPILKNENQKRVFNAKASSNYKTKLSFKVQGNLNYFKMQI